MSETTWELQQRSLLLAGAVGRAQQVAVGRAKQEGLGRRARETMITGAAEGLMLGSEIYLGLCMHSFMYF